MEIIVEAVKLATELHSCQRRKKALPDIPKTGHLMEVAGIVQNNGGDAITVAAALLHDAVEDHGVEVRDKIRAKFGQEVLNIIEACTESETFPRPSWRKRKEAYLKLVETASLPALLVMVADKLQNIRALLRRIKLEGAEGWGNPGRAEKLWYKQSLLRAMRQRLAQLEQETDHPTLVSVRLLIEEFAELVAALTHYETRMVRSAAHGDPRVALV